jgi:hypothetical protein
MHDPTNLGNSDPNASFIEGADNRQPPQTSYVELVSDTHTPLTLTDITQTVQATLGNDQVRINRDPGRAGRPKTASYHDLHIGAPPKYAKPEDEPRTPEYIIALPVTVDVEDAKTRLRTLGIESKDIRSISNRADFYHNISLPEARMVEALVRSTHHYPEAERIDEAKAQQIINDPAELTKTVQKLFTNSPEKHRRWKGYEGMTAHKTDDGRVVISHMPKNASLQATFQLPDKEFASEPVPINGLIVKATLLEHAVQKALSTPSRSGESSGG